MLFSPLVVNLNAVTSHAKEIKPKLCSLFQHWPNSLTVIFPCEALLPFLHGWIFHTILSDNLPL